MDNKAAIEMSASFLVTVIIAIVFFSFMLYLGLNSMKGAEEYSTTLNEQTAAQAEHMLDSGHDSVVMPFKQKDVLKGELILFAVGIRNVVDDIGRPARGFKVRVFFNKEKSADGVCDGKGNDNVCKSYYNTNWVKMTSGSNNMDLVIEPRQKRIVSVGILPPLSADDGVYAFDIRICYNDEDNSNDPSPLCDAGLLKDYYIENMLIKTTVKS